jgi:hypothetical protein
MRVRICNTEPTSLATEMVAATGGSIGSMVGKVPLPLATNLLWHYEVAYL